MARNFDVAGPSRRALQRQGAPRLRDSIHSHTLKQIATYCMRLYYMAKTAALAFRIQENMKAALEKAATADSRSVSSLVEKILREWLGAQAKARKGK
jgi:hypothetical protein